MRLPDKKPDLLPRLLGWLRQLASLPEPPEFDYPFARSDIAMLAGVEGGAAQIDAQTWDDMLLDSYSVALAEQTSIFGQQRLHQRLASGVADSASTARVRALLAAPDEMVRLQQAMHGLRSVDMEVSAPLLGKPIDPPPWWRRLLLLPPLALLLSLAARHLVIVSSHNLVLAPLLAGCLAPWCVRRDTGGALLLAPGVLQATNGIALLTERGFGRQIEDQASRVFDWLSSHMAQPADCSGVLAPA